VRPFKSQITTADLTVNIYSNSHKSVVESHRDLTRLHRFASMQAVLAIEPLVIIPSVSPSVGQRRELLWRKKLLPIFCYRIKDRSS